LVWPAKTQGVWEDILTVNRNCTCYAADPKFKKCSTFWALQSALCN
jgi:hypothetical protein